jgi:hypothetical protein
MFGRTVLGVVGTSIQLLADGRQGDKPVGGITIDWSTVAAVSGSDAVLSDSVTVKVGSSYLRYGQVICKITASGKYGPYDPAATDGRQTLARGSAWLLNRTVVNNDPKADYPDVINGGTVYKARLIQAGTGAASLAAGPTLANLESTFPKLDYATV